ncbi:polysaccharide biosynthesis protein [Bacillus thuringiensis]|uniref:polysaccharide biosynthesis protein n=1 Tax=Bacillus thuringiensis TaxID=1428 RepID=UPI003BF74A27
MLIPLFGGWAKTSNIEIEILGIRLGRKIHEVLISEYESKNTISYDNEYNE